MLILNTALGIENLSNKSLSLILNHLKIEELDRGEAEKKYGWKTFIPKGNKSTI